MLEEESRNAPTLGQAKANGNCDSNPSLFFWQIILLATQRKWSKRNLICFSVPLVTRFGFLQPAFPRTLGVDHRTQLAKIAPA